MSDKNSKLFEGMSKDEVIASLTAEIAVIKSGVPIIAVGMFQVTKKDGSPGKSYATASFTNSGRPFNMGIAKVKGVIYADSNYNNGLKGLLKDLEDKQAELDSTVNK